MDEQGPVAVGLVVDGLVGHGADDGVLGGAGAGRVAERPLAPRLRLAGSRRVAPRVDRGGGDGVEVRPGVGARVINPDAAGLVEGRHVRAAAAAEEEDARADNGSDVAHARDRHGAELRSVLGGRLLALGRLRLVDKRHLVKASLAGVGVVLGRHGLDAVVGGGAVPGQADDVHVVFDGLAGGQLAAPDVSGAGDHVERV